MKTAELSGTNVLMPSSVAPDTGTTPEADPMTVKSTKKTSAAVLPGVNDATSGCTPKSLLQAKAMKPHIDVTGMTPPVVIKEKKAQLFALHGSYPLDSYEHVKLASAYFDNWYKEMRPADRHEYAVNMVKRAEELGVEVSESARRYGSEKYASAADLKVALDVRALVVDEELRPALQKLSSMQPNLTPDMFARVLGEFDKTAGINHLYDKDIPDPYYSTFGFTKKAEFSETIGNLTVNEEDLEYLASNHLKLVKGVFTQDFAETFRKNPVDIYKSMPVTQRKILANMAREQRAGAPGS